MQDEIGRERGGPAPQAARSLIIVVREQRDLWQSLLHEFKDVERIQVLLDRRYGERRTPRGPVPYDRRARERRSLLRFEDDLRARQYVLVRPHDRRPRD
ncbi:MAG: hypothetical protein EHM71_12790 [Zetaproteobacteria bacterium]|nr:MAG: hypothetical protein EHM71_12790 [Zetaproteobacteria bacterium]